MRSSEGFSSLEIMVAGLILSGSILLALQWQSSSGLLIRQAIEEYLAGVQAQEMANLLAMSGELTDTESARLLGDWIAASRKNLSEPAVSFNGVEQRLTLSWYSHSAGQRLSLSLQVP